jgi:hypothetical protein
MATVTVRASAEFPAPAALLYDIIADYEEGHPSILPDRYFTHLHVERGGRGAGTIIRFGMKLGGRVQEVRSEVSEPEPGRVLVERVFDERGTTTTFTVDPIGPDAARVTFHTTWRANGWRGLVERWVAPTLLRRVYRAELAQLGRVARSPGDRPTT